MMHGLEWACYIEKKEVKAIIAGGEDSHLQLEDDIRNEDSLAVVIVVDVPKGIDKPYFDRMKGRDEAKVALYTHHFGAA